MAAAAAYRGLAIAAGQRENKHENKSGAARANEPPIRWHLSAAVATADEAEESSPSAAQSGLKGAFAAAYYAHTRRAQGTLARLLARSRAPYLGVFVRFRAARFPVRRRRRVRFLARRWRKTDELRPKQLATLPCIVAS